MTTTTKTRKNSWRKQVKKEDAYYTVTDHRNGFEYFVLNVNSDPRKEFARAMCVVISPYTTSLGDMGDTYCKEVPGLVSAWLRVHEIKECAHCGRSIMNENGTWVDPEASGDDSVWRETCDANEAFTGEHTPKEGE